MTTKGQKCRKDTARMMLRCAEKKEAEGRVTAGTYQAVSDCWKWAQECECPTCHA